MIYLEIPIQMPISNTNASQKKTRTNASNASMEDVVDILRKRIVSQELPPGSKLSEAELTDEFKVSRPRIREAFGVLEDRGLIERIPNKGAVVTRLGKDDIFALFEMREVLEALSVRLATEKSSPNTWDDLFDRFGEPAKEALAHGDLDYYMDCITEFRQSTISAAQNPILSVQMEALYDRTRVLLRRLLLVPGRAEQGRIQHREILAAMKAGNAELAEQLKRKNVRSSRESFASYQHYLL